MNLLREGGNDKEENDELIEKLDTAFGDNTHVRYLTNLLREGKKLGAPIDKLSREELGHLLGFYEAFSLENADELSLFELGNRVLSVSKEQDKILSLISSEKDCFSNTADIIPIRPPRPESGNKLLQYDRAGLYLNTDPRHFSMLLKIGQEGPPEYQPIISKMLYQMRFSDAVSVSSEKINPQEKKLYNVLNSTRERTQYWAYVNETSSFTDPHAWLRRLATVSWDALHTHGSSKKSIDLVIDEILTQHTKLYHVGQYRNFPAENVWLSLKAGMKILGPFFKACSIDPDDFETSLFARQLEALKLEDGQVDTLRETYKNISLPRELAQEIELDTKMLEKRDFRDRSIASYHAIKEIEAECGTSSHFSRMDTLAVVAEALKEGQKTYRVRSVSVQQTRKVLSDSLTGDIDAYVLLDLMRYTDDAQIYPALLEYALTHHKLSDLLLYYAPLTQHDRLKNYKNHLGTPIQMDQNFVKKMFDTGTPAVYASFFDLLKNPRYQSYYNALMISAFMVKEEQGRGDFTKNVVEHLFQNKEDCLASLNLSAIGIILSHSSISPKLLGLFDQFKKFELTVDEHTRAFDFINSYLPEEKKPTSVVPPANLSEGSTARGSKKATAEYTPPLYELKAESIRHFFQKHADAPYPDRTSDIRTFQEQFSHNGVRDHISNTTLQDASSESLLTAHFSDLKVTPKNDGYSISLGIGEKINLLVKVHMDGEITIRYFNEKNTEIPITAISLAGAGKFLGITPAFFQELHYFCLSLLQPKPPEPARIVTDTKEVVLETIEQPAWVTALKRLPLYAHIPELAYLAEKFHKKERIQSPLEEVSSRDITALFRLYEAFSQLGPEDKWILQALEKEVLDLDPLQRQICVGMVQINKSYRDLPLEAHELKKDPAVVLVLKKTDLMLLMKILRDAPAEYKSMVAYHIYQQRWLSSVTSGSMTDQMRVFEELLSQYIRNKTYTPIVLDYMHGWKEATPSLNSMLILKKWAKGNQPLKTSFRETFLATTAGPFINTFLNSRNISQTSLDDLNAQLFFFSRLSVLVGWEENDAYQKLKNIVLAELNNRRCFDSDQLDQIARALSEESVPAGYKEQLTDQVRYFFKVYVDPNDKKTPVPQKSAAALGELEKTKPNILLGDFLEIEKLSVLIESSANSRDEQAIKDQLTRLARNYFHPRHIHQVYGMVDKLRKSHASLSRKLLGHYCRELPFDNLAVEDLFRPALPLNAASLDTLRPDMVKFPLHLYSEGITTDLYEVLLEVAVRSGQQKFLDVFMSLLKKNNSVANVNAFMTLTGLLAKNNAQPDYRRFFTQHLFSEKKDFFIPIRLSLIANIFQANFNKTNGALRRELAELLVGHPHFPSDPQEQQYIFSFWDSDVRHYFTEALALKQEKDQKAARKLDTQITQQNRAHAETARSQLLGNLSQVSYPARTRDIHELLEKIRSNRSIMLPTEWDTVPLKDVSDLTRILTSSRIKHIPHKVTLQDSLRCNISFLTSDQLPLYCILDDRGDLAIRLLDTNGQEKNRISKNTPDPSLVSSGLFQELHFLCLHILATVYLRQPDTGQSEMVQNHTISSPTSVTVPSPNPPTPAGPGKVSSRPEAKLTVDLTDKSKLLDKEAGIIAGTRIRENMLSAVEIFSPLYHGENLPPFHKLSADLQQKIAALILYEEVEVDSYITYSRIISPPRVYEDMRLGRSKAGNIFLRTSRAHTQSLPYIESRQQGYSVSAIIKKKPSAEALFRYENFIMDQSGETLQLHTGLKFLHFRVDTNDYFVQALDQVFQGGFTAQACTPEKRQQLKRYFDTIREGLAPNELLRIKQLNDAKYLFHMIFRLAQPPREEEKRQIEKKYMQEYSERFRMLRDKLRREYLETDLPNLPRYLRLVTGLNEKIEREYRNAVEEHYSILDQLSRRIKIIRENAPAQVSGQQPPERVTVELPQYGFESHETFNQGQFDTLEHLLQLSQDGLKAVASTSPSHQNDIS